MLNTIRELKLFRGDYIAFRDIDKKFLAEFTDFLRQAPKASRYGLRKIGGGLLSNNSVVAYYGTLRTAINRAYKEGIITVNPTKEFDFVGKVRQEPSRREYLTIDELKTLINTECRHEIVKRAFLFSCLCGLRVSDIRKLKWCDLQRSGGRVRIEITMQKTKEPLYLPISDEALKWLPERGEANDSDFIFPLTHERTCLLYTSDAATLGESRRNNQTHFVSIHGIYGSSTTKSVNPSDIIAGILIQNGFIIVSEIKSELAKETVIVNYGESGRRNRRFGYTIEVTIQFISADTNQMICSCTAEGQGSTEADDIRQAIKRALDGLFAELR